MKGSERVVIASFPEPAAHPYTQLLYASLERRGFEVLPGNFTGRWFLQHLPRLDYCHFHWPSFHYSGTDCALATRIYMFVRFTCLMCLIRVYRVRIVWTAHNLYPHDGGKASLLHRIARHLVVWMSAAIFVHGKTPKEVVLAEFPRAQQKIWSIDHGHMIDYYLSDTNRKQARAMLGLREDRFVYLFFGSCREYKNLELLIEALAETPPDCVLMIAGRFHSDAYRQKIQDLLDPFGDRVIFRPGWIDDDEFQFLLTACDVVVLPYKEILTSGAVMLALSFGRPVVSCEKGSLLDVVTPAVGVLYSSGTAEDVARAMAQARDTVYDREEIIEYARTFSWDDSAEITAQAMSRSDT